MFLAPFWTEVPVIELIHLRRNPGTEMHPVGDVTDGDLILRHAGPNGFPHAAADLAVEFADAIAGRRRAQRKDGHAELLIGGLRVLAPQPVELRGSQPQAANVLAEV